MKKYLNEHSWLKCLVYIFFFLLVVYLVLLIAYRPSHDRLWEKGQEELPYIDIKESGEISITNFRNFDWQKEGETTPRYETRNYSLGDIETVDVLISHFAEFEGLAHIFLSFGLINDQQIVISYETRREIGEEFSAVLGMLRQFEVIYVVGSEEDIVGVRTDVREGERVYLYPTKASPEKAKELFIALTEDINSVYKKPRIYHTLLRNCTNEITRRVEDISDVDFPLTWKTVLPGYFDEVLYEMDLIDTSAAFLEIKDKHFIDNDSVNRYDASYSIDLRKKLQSSL